MSKSEMYATAHKVVDALLATEMPGPGVENPEAWLKAVRNRIRGDYWQRILNALEVDPDLDPVELAVSMRSVDQAQKPAPAPKWEAPNPSTALPTYTAATVPTATPEDRERATERLRAIRASLKGQTE